MAPIDDDTLDRLLGNHMAARLDGQRGRAETSFRRRFVEEPGFASGGGAERDGNAADDAPSLRLAGASAPTPARPTMTTGGRLRLFASIAGTAVAASLATLFLLPKLSPQDRGGKVSVSSQPSTPSVGVPVSSETFERPMVRYVQNRTWDEGVVSQDGAPRRQLRHEQVEQYQWYDPQRKANIRLIVPRQNLELREVDSY